MHTMSVLQFDLNMRGSYQKRWGVDGEDQITFTDSVLTFKHNSLGDEVREDGQYDHHDSEEEHLLHSCPYALLLSHLAVSHYSKPGP